MRNSGYMAWESYFATNNRYCFNMPGGIHCPGCKKVNTAQIKHVEISLIGQFPEVTAKYVTTMLCNKCKSEWTASYSIEPRHVEK